MTPVARRRAELVLVAITGGWALTFVIVQDALDDASPGAFLVARFGLAFFAGALLSGRRLFRRDTLVDACRLGPFMFVGYAAQTIGLLHTTPARAAFLTGLSVLFVPCLTVVRTRSLPSPPLAAGVALATAGLWVLAGPTGAQWAETWLGDLLCVVCALAFAGHIALTESASRRHAALPLVTWQFAFVSTLSLALLPVGTRRFELTPRLGAALLFCGLFASLAFLALQTWGQRQTTASRAAMIFALEPLAAATYSVSLGREPLSPSLLWGGALLLGALLTVEVGGEAWHRRLLRARQVSGATLP